ncbi:MAG: DHHA1 domain-containing protein [Pseudomonadota bacterium]
MANKTYVIYHNDCPDGFGSAWSFYKKLGRKDVTYIPMDHGNTPPAMEKGAMVYIADFSFSRDILLQLKKDHPGLLLLDHHKSAKAELEGLDFVQFDMNRSGAVMSWQYLFPDKKIPHLLEYVQDRDLWTWKLSRSKEVHSYVSTVDYKLDAWDHLVDEVENNCEQVIKFGEILLKSDELEVESICAHARLLDFCGHNIPCVNSIVLHSETGNRLLQIYSQAPFALCWYINKKGDIRASYRSRGDFDVSEIAKKFGGGGHKAAAGSNLTEIPR